MKANIMAMPITNPMEILTEIPIKTPAKIPIERQIEEIVTNGIGYSNYMVREKISRNLEYGEDSMQTALDLQMHLGKLDASVAKSDIMGYSIEKNLTALSNIAYNFSSTGSKESIKTFDINSLLEGYFIGQSVRKPDLDMTSIPPDSPFIDDFCSNVEEQNDDLSRSYRHLDISC